MSDPFVRRVIVMVMLGICWGTLCDAWDIPLLGWLAGLVALDLVIFKAFGPRTPKQSERPGPSVEWID